MKNKIVLLILTFFILLSIGQRSFAREADKFDLSDGYYKVNVSLWHSSQDRESMGNKALNQDAEIEVKNGIVSLYLESKKLKVQDIESSMLNFYYPDEKGDYRKSEEACYDLEIKNEIKKRPRIFKINLYNKSKYTDVLIDPKVEVMGKDPIKARLKINWDSLKESKIDDLKIIRDFNKDKDGEKEEEKFKEDNGVLLYFNKDTFKDDFDLIVSELSENEKLDLKSVLNSDNFLGYRLKTSKKVNVIPKDNEGSIEHLREEVIPEKEIIIKIPVDNNENIKLYKLEKNDKREINFNKEDNYIYFKDNSLGLYILEKNNQELKKNIIPMSNTKNKNSLNKASKYIINKNFKKEETKKAENSNINNSSRKKFSNIENKNLENTNTQKINQKVEKNEVVKENKFIIILSIFVLILILYFSIYTIKKYKEKLVEEISIYFELKERTRKLEK